MSASLCPKCGMEHLTIDGAIALAALYTGEFLNEAMATRTVTLGTREALIWVRNALRRGWIVGDGSMCNLVIKG